MCGWDAKPMSYVPKTALSLYGSPHPGCHRMSLYGPSIIMDHHD